MTTRRRLTRDRQSTPEPVKGHSRFYTTEQLGPKQSLTPEGFLLCEDVPLARSGEMIYGPDETPIKGVHGSPVVIHRDPEELFNPTTIGSGNGKDVVNDHPDDDVTPANFRKLTGGVMLNLRPGEGDNDGLLVGDILVKDPDCINEVRAGKREVSLGYDADYEEVSPGVGKQTNIIINHVALVERGRCGPRCAIGDRQTVTEKESLKMATATGKNTATPPRRRLKLAITKFRDAAEQLENELGEEGEGTMDEGEGVDTGQHIHIHLNGEGSTATGTNATAGKDGSAATPGGMSANGGAEEGVNATPGAGATQDDPNEARFQALEKGHEEIKGSLAQILTKLAGGGGEQTPAADELKPEEAEAMAEETGKPKEEVAKFRDSAPLGESYRETLQLAEILVPGFRMPTYDAAAKPRDTLTSICGARRKALDAAYMTEGGKSVIDTVSGGKPFDTTKMSCAAVRALFLSAAGAKKLINNSAARDHQSTGAGQGASKANKAGAINSIQDLNAFNRAHYGKTKAH